MRLSVFLHAILRRTQGYRVTVAMTNAWPVVMELSIFKGDRVAVATFTDDDLFDENIEATWLAIETHAATVFGTKAEALAK